MYSSIAFAIFFLVIISSSFFVLRPTASSSSLPPLKVTMYRSKSADAIAPRPPMAKPLPASQPSVDFVVAGAQRLSLDDATSDVDILLGSFSKLSIKADPLRSCLKLGPRAANDNRRVHFHTLPHYPDVDVCELRRFTIRPREHPPKGGFATSILPQTPGPKVTRLNPNGTVDLLKALGSFDSPGPPQSSRPLCGHLQARGFCLRCGRLPWGPNTWHLEPDFISLLAEASASTTSLPVPNFT